MMSSNLRASAVLLSAILFSVTLAGSPALADTNDLKLMIFDATVVEGRNGWPGEITLRGQAFPYDAYVTFHGLPTTIVGDTSANEIVFQIPKRTSPGTYRVSVGDWTCVPPCCGDGDGCFEVTIGASACTTKHRPCPARHNVYGN